MPKSLKLLLIGVVAGSAVALVAATLVLGAYGAIALPPPAPGQEAPLGDILLGIAFWTALTLVSSALPVQMPRGTQQAVSFAPIPATIFPLPSPREVGIKNMVLYLTIRAYSK
jgi:hypothetical protein